MKINLIAILLIVAVALSGCTNIFGGTTPTGGIVGPGTNGVVITNFFSDIPTIEAGTPVVLTLTIQNKGERTASNIKAEVFGLTDWTKTSGDNPTTFADLAGSDPSRGFEGEANSAQWEYSKSQAAAVDVDYAAVARVSYNYSTVSSSLVKVASSEYLRSIGGNPSQFGLVSSQTTGGPLTVTVKMGTPIITAGSKPKVQFEITNTGGGRVYNGQTSASNLDKITSFTASPQLSCSGAIPKLVDNKAMITCTLNVDVGSNQFVQVPVELTLKYNYFVDQSTTVKVLRAAS